MGIMKKFHSYKHKKSKDDVSVIPIEDWEVPFYIFSQYEDVTNEKNKNENMLLQF
jgi:hypothetical protein